MSSHRLSSARAPAVQHVLDTLAHLPSSRLPVNPRHRQPVIVGVDVADRRRNGQPYGVRIKRSPSCASPDPAAAARGRVTRDRLGPADGAAREQRTDRGGKLGREIHVLVGSSCLVPLPSTSPHLGVGEALDFGKLDRLGLGQDALAFVALARPALPHNNGRESAGLLRAPGQRRIARRQEDEMSKIGAVQA